MRFILQKNSFGCGPVALINFLKFKGYGLTYQCGYKYYSWIMGTDQEGTHTKDFERVLKLFIDFKILKGKLPRRINNGILEYVADCGHYHYAFVFRDKGGWQVTNDSINKTTVSHKLYNNREMRNLIRRKDTYLYVEDY